MALDVQPDVERRVLDQVQSGDYTSPNAVLVDALDALDAWRKALSDDLDKRWEESESPDADYVEADEVFAGLRAKGRSAVIGSHESAAVPPIGGARP